MPAEPAVFKPNERPVLSESLFVTIAPTNQLPRALVLAQSLRAAYGPGAGRLLVLHIGQLPVPMNADAADVLDLVGFDQLRIPTLWDFAFRYNKEDLANVLKPFFLDHVLRHWQPRSLVFLDVETQVYGPLDEVHRLLDAGASIVLTPYLERPQFEVADPHRTDAALPGVMNDGFAAIANDPAAGELLAWWTHRLLATHPSEGPGRRGGEPHWLDLAPAFFSGVHVLRDRSYNVGWWNYADRAPRWAEDKWWVGASPLRFFSFRGWRLEEPDSLKGATRGLAGSADAHLARLFTEYRDRCDAAARALGPDIADAPYAFGSCLDGTPIPAVAREAYAWGNPPRAWTREQLFADGLAFLSRSSASVPRFPDVETTDLFVYLAQKRADLGRYDLRTRAGQLGLLRWALDHAAADYDLPDEALEPARWTVARESERERRVKALIGRAREVHERVREGRSDSLDLLPLAAELIELFRIRCALAPRPENTLDTVARFFGAVHRLRGEGAPGLDRPKVQRLFDDMEAHGKYLAGKLDVKYASFLDSGARTREPLLEADAILNACSLLAELHEQWLDLEGELPPASAPKSIFSDGESASPSAPMAAWAIEQLRDLTDIEPRLGLQLEESPQAFRLSRVRPRHHPLLRCFEDNRNVLEPPPAAVLAFPSAENTGEFDRVMLVEAAQEALGRENVLVMVLGEEPAPDNDGFDQGTRVFAIERRAPYLSAAQRFDFVRDYLAGTQPAVMVNDDCPLLWRLYKEFSKQFSAMSRLYALVPGLQRTEAGTPAGFAVTHLPDVLDDLAGVCASHAAFAPALSSMFALPPKAESKIMTFRQPVPIRELDRRPSLRAFERNGRRGIPPRVLWADHITGATRPDLLVEVARLRPSYDFVAVGDHHNPRRDGKDLFEAPNLLYRNGFAHWDALPFGDFDAVLATASNEGVPRVLLAATAARLPLVAGPRGGVGELVADGRGWPVENDADPEGYAAALDELLFERDARAQRIDRMTEYLAHAHSRTAYLDRVKTLGLFDVG